MKKFVGLLSVLLTVSMLMFSGLAYATPSYENNVPVAWKALVLNNTTGGYTEHIVPVETIRPGKSILGYVIIPLGTSSTNSESVVGLYDGLGATGTVSDELFDEAEADGTKSLPTWFPYPRKILTQLMVRIGPNTRVLIYWE